ncbi:hypothetical protein [Amycolatopsis cihanbeyliensis]|uniref:PPE family protein n=1 Tax=Amycolatopsis cihanbeyliensis TaxID=1128664 RepID=A0A542DLD3_AMYCI|nr:hypothetical protein [Amycolatopsis cihanbeyliensis]TQJ03883.1 hypothetical protein FB471_3657 [Amycolatopsis cihanbeyliensis]
MGYSGADIYRRMNAVPNTTETLDAAQVTAHQLMVRHERIADRIARIQDGIHGYWEGDAAERANTGMIPILNASKQAASDLGIGKNSMYEQNSAFHEVRGRLEPLEDDFPPISFGSFPWESSARDTTAEWVRKNQNNIQQYEVYASSSEANGTNLAREYPVLDPAVGGMAVGSAPTSGQVGEPSDSGPAVRVPDRDAGPVSAPRPDSPRGGGSWTPPPPEHTPEPQPRLPVAKDTEPSQHPDDSTNASRFTPPPTGSPDSTAYRPPASGTAPPGGPGQGGTGFGPVGSGGATGFGPRGSGGYGGSGGARGFGPGTGGQPAPGRGTGAVPPGGSNPAGSARGPGQAGAPGRPGAMGAPMGAGAGRGKGGEDEEHQRKTKVPGEDPDEVFGGLPEGTKTVPPTIGDTNK